MPRGSRLITRLLIVIFYVRTATSGIVSAFPTGRQLISFTLIRHFPLFWRFLSVPGENREFGKESLGRVHMAGHKGLGMRLTQIVAEMPPLVIVTFPWRILTTNQKRLNIELRICLNFRGRKKSLLKWRLKKVSFARWNIFPLLVEKRFLLLVE